MTHALARSKFGDYFYVNHLYDGLCSGRNERHLEYFFQWPSETLVPPFLAQQIIRKHILHPICSRPSCNSIKLLLHALPNGCAGISDETWEDLIWKHRFDWQKNPQSWQVAQWIWREQKIRKIRIPICNLTYMNNLPSSRYLGASLSRTLGVNVSRNDRNTWIIHLAILIGCFDPPPHGFFFLSSSFEIGHKLWQQHTNQVTTVCKVALPDLPVSVIQFIVVEYI